MRFPMGSPHDGALIQNRDASHFWATFVSHLSVLLDISDLLAERFVEMVLTIACKQFAFERAQARIISSDWDNPSNLAQGDPAALFEPIDVVDDRVASVSVSAPGEFLLLLTGLMVRRFLDNRRFHVAPFFTRFNLTDADVQQGSARVILNPVGVFRVSIFDRGHEPLRGRELVLSRDNMKICFLTDADGAVLFLGDPTHGQPTHFGIAAGTATISITSL